MLIIDFVLMTFMFMHPYTYMAFKKKKPINTYTTHALQTG